MLRLYGLLALALPLVAPLAASASGICPPAVAYYAPAPAVSYYAPAPVVTYAAPVAAYYAAPVTAYYRAPAAVTTTRYGLLGRARSTTTYYGAAPVVTYRAPAVIAPRVSYYSPVLIYP